jgi:hypothetical protein
MLSDVAGNGDGSGDGERLCMVCAKTLGVGGVGVTVVADGGPPATLCASDAVAVRIEELQYTLGEGPAIDAQAGGRAIAEPDLASPRRVRWPLLAGPAVEAGAGALFAFPLRTGAVRLGALTLHQPRPGPLSDVQHSDAIAVADMVLHLVVARQADAPLGTLAADLAPLGSHRAEVHQASGMVSVQLSVSVAEALVRLRARAFREGRPLEAVAADVVARRARFER